MADVALAKFGALHDADSEQRIALFRQAVEILKQLSDVSESQLQTCAEKLSVLSPPEAMVCGKILLDIILSWSPEQTSFSGVLDLLPPILSIASADASKEASCFQQYIIDQLCPTEDVPWPPSVLFPLVHMFRDLILTPGQLTQVLETLFCALPNPNQCCEGDIHLLPPLFYQLFLIAMPCKERVLTATVEYFRTLDEAIWRPGFFFFKTFVIFPFRLPSRSFTIPALTRRTSTPPAHTQEMGRVLLRLLKTHPRMICPFGCAVAMLALPEPRLLDQVVDLLCSLLRAQSKQADVLRAMELMPWIGPLPPAGGRDDGDGKAPLADCTSPFLDKYGLNPMMNTLSNPHCINTLFLRFTLGIHAVGEAMGLRIVRCGSELLDAAGRHSPGAAGDPAAVGAQLLLTAFAFHPHVREAVVEACLLRLQTATEMPDLMAGWVQLTARLFIEQRPLLLAMSRRGKDDVRLVSSSPPRDSLFYLMVRLINPFCHQHPPHPLSPFCPWLDPMRQPIHLQVLALTPFPSTPQPLHLQLVLALPGIPAPLARPLLLAMLPALQADEALRNHILATFRQALAARHLNGRLVAVEGLLLLMRACATGAAPAPARESVTGSQPSYAMASGTQPSYAMASGAHRSGNRVPKNQVQDQNRFDQQHVPMHIWRQAGMQRVSVWALISGLPDGGITQFTFLATGFLQVWALASQAISGLPGGGGTQLAAAGSQTQVEQILGVLRRALQQQPLVRTQLYSGLLAVCSAPQMRPLLPTVAALVLERLALYTEQPSFGTPAASLAPIVHSQAVVNPMASPILLRIDAALISPDAPAGIRTRVVEPLPALLATATGVSFMETLKTRRRGAGVKDEEPVPALEASLARLAIALSQSGLEDYRIDKAADFKEPHMAARGRMLRGCLEALLGHVLLRLDPTSALPPSDPPLTLPVLIGLYKLHDRIDTKLREAGVGGGLEDTTGGAEAAPGRKKKGEAPAKGGGDEDLGGAEEDGGGGGGCAEEAEEEKPKGAKEGKDGEGGKKRGGDGKGKRARDETKGSARQPVAAPVLPFQSVLSFLRLWLQDCKARSKDPKPGRSQDPEAAAPDREQNGQLTRQMKQIPRRRLAEGRPR
ncbi:putative fanconi anemia group I protein [Paratrimastix pyriformis]|uniref:Fanconi anemia group I protein n=1 Tax=Paratrimastix pyriformis TaxID=342808 RepID=A0ABQ8UAQ9_9EUKA|nr:putative fanconi anemia group I protein [Paratrimastix pyriformis]